MVNNRTLRKDLIEAWERYTNESDTCDDLALILDSIDDEHIHEFVEVAQREWDMAMNSLPPTPEEKEKYRKRAAQFLAEYEKRQKLQKLQTRHLPSRNFRRIWYAAAAALLLGLLIPAVNLYVKPKTEQPVQYVETVT